MTERIAVLMGGTSTEREISLKSGAGVAQALREAGCEVEEIDVMTEDRVSLLSELQSRQIDLAFIAMHGPFGEDGTLQAILEEAGIAFTGSSAKTSRLAMDKTATQQLLGSRHIVIPPYAVVSKDDGTALEQIFDKLGGDVFVKPGAEGSSFGISRVTGIKHLDQALREAYQYGDKVLLEKCIQGRELTAGILGDVVLPLIEIKPNNGFFDHSSKYQDGQTEYIVPASLRDQENDAVVIAAKNIWRILEGRDFGRLDFILGHDGQPYFLELNSIPGFTQSSLLPMAAKAQGISFSELCRQIVDMAKQRRKGATQHG